MREDLPGALITVFDSDLRLILAAGHAFGRKGGSSTYREGRSLAEAFPRGALAADRAALPFRPTGRYAVADDPHC